VGIVIKLFSIAGFIKNKVTCELIISLFCHVIERDLILTDVSGHNQILSITSKLNIGMGRALDAYE